jgi:hypothetical protein
MKSMINKIWMIGLASAMTACTQATSFGNNGQSALDGSQNIGTGGTGGGGGSTSGPSCSTNLGTTKELTKMLFIIDMSGSNQSGPGCTVGPNCTDPNKTMRAGSIQKFFNDYGARSNFQWGFEVFNGTTSTPLIKAASGMPEFSDGADMQAGINTFEGMLDTDNTPYMAGLTTAYTTILNDPDLHSANNPQYLVVFMSDGQPTDSNTTALTSEVQSIVNLLPGKITFNTVYYGNNDAMAAGLLQNMAQVGGGNFLNTATNPMGLDFAISDLIVVPCP